VSLAEGTRKDVIMRLIDDSPNLDRTEDYSRIYSAVQQRKTALAKHGVDFDAMPLVEGQRGRRSTVDVAALNALLTQGSEEGSEEEGGE
jgi:hypothetical protein